MYSPLFEGLNGAIKGLETFVSALDKAHTWYHQNSRNIENYLLAFAEFAEWSVAIDKLIDNQFVFTDSLAPSLAHEIYQGADVYEIMSFYYLGNGEENIKNLIQRCKSSDYIQEYRELFDQILNSYDRDDYLLACIGLFSLIDGLLADCSGINITGFKTRLASIADKVADKVELNEIERKSICIYTAFIKFDCSIFQKSDFSEDEPQVVNRHWDVHGRTHRKHTKIDFLQILLWLDAVIYLTDLSHD